MLFFFFAIMIYTQIQHRKSRAFLKMWLYWIWQNKSKNIPLTKGQGHWKYLYIDSHLVGRTSLLSSVMKLCISNGQGDVINPIGFQGYQLNVKVKGFCKVRNISSVRPPWTNVLQSRSLIKGQGQRVNYVLSTGRQDFD